MSAAGRARLEVERASIGVEALHDRPRSFAHDLLSAHGSVCTSSQLRAHPVANLPKPTLARAGSTRPSSGTRASRPCSGRSGRCGSRRRSGPDGSGGWWPPRCRRSRRRWRRRSPFCLSTRGPRASRSRRASFSCSSGRRAARARDSWAGVVITGVASIGVAGKATLALLDPVSFVGWTLPVLEAACFAGAARRHGDRRPVDYAPRTSCKSHAPPA